MLRREPATFRPGLKHKLQPKVMRSGRCSQQAAPNYCQEVSLPLAHSCVYSKEPNISTSELSNSRLLLSAGHQVPGACRQWGPAGPPAASRIPCGACRDQC